MEEEKSVAVGAEENTAELNNAGEDAAQEGEILVKKTKPKIKNTLAEGNIFKKLVIFTIPILLTNLFQQTYNLADAVMVGRFISKEALAAVGTNNTIINLLLGLFLGLGAGGGVLVAQYYGAKQEGKVTKAVHNIIIISLIFGAVMSVAGYLLARPILELIDCPADVIEYSTVYLQIYFLGVVPVMFYNMGASILRAMGNSVLPLVYLIIGAVTNVGIDLYWVAYLRLGIVATAWSTVIAQAVSAALVLITLLFIKSPARLSFKHFKIDFDEVKKIFALGFPAGLQSVMYSIANILLQANLSSFGSDVMAGWVAANKIDILAYSPIQSFGIAVNTFVGQNIGAKQPERVKKGVYAACALTLGTAVLIIIPTVIFRRELVSIFNDHETVLHYGAMAVSYIMPFYALFGLTEVLAGTLRGLGKTGISASLSAAGILGTRLTWLYTAVKIWHTPDMLFMIYPVSWTLNFLLFMIYFIVKKWKGVLTVPKGFVPKEDIDAGEL